MEGAIETHQLLGNRVLEIHRNPSDNLVRILGPDGEGVVTIHITPTGVTLRLPGRGASLRIDGDLAIDAERVSIHGRSGVAITSDGDLETRARIQNVTAELGNVNIRANDDVKMDGERILMNVDD